MDIGDIGLGAGIDDAEGFGDIGGFIQEMEDNMKAEKRLAWMKITREVMESNEDQQRKIITDIAEMIGLRI